MNPIEKIEWEPKYSVDIEEIDAHQKKMFELFNQLIDMKRSKTESKECINMISVINEYSKLYFSTEEKYLKNKNQCVLDALMNEISKTRYFENCCPKHRCPNEGYRNCEDGK